MGIIAQRLPFYDYQEGLSWIWQELDDLIPYLPNLVWTDKQVVALENDCAMQYCSIFCMHVMQDLLTLQFDEKLDQFLINFQPWHTRSENKKKQELVKSENKN